MRYLCDLAEKKMKDSFSISIVRPEPSTIMEETKNI